MELEQIVQRALCLKAVGAFAHAWPDEAALSRLKPDEVLLANRDSDRFWELVRESGVYESLTPAEKAFAAQRLPGVSQRDVVQFSWRVEAYKTLLWAASVVDELGPYWELADPELTKLKATQIRSMARLRSEEAIARERDIAELWHWRSRTRQLGYEDVVGPTAASALESGDLEEVVDDDFGVRGIPYGELSEQDFATVTSITTERHHALNWLCGEDVPWDEVRTDT